MNNIIIIPRKTTFQQGFQRIIQWLLPDCCNFMFIIDLHVSFCLGQVAQLHAVSLIMEFFSPVRHVRPRETFKNYLAHYNVISLPYIHHHQSIPCVYNSIGLSISHFLADINFHFTHCPQGDSEYWNELSTKETWAGPMHGEPHYAYYIHRIL